MSTLARLVLVLGLLLPLTACKNKKKSGNTDTDDSGTSGLLPGAPGRPAGKTGKDQLAELRAERPMPAFTGVDLGIDADAVVTAGDKYSVKVEAPDDVLPKIDVQVAGGQLTLGWVPKEVISGKPKVTFAVVAPKLDAAKAAFGRLQVPKLAGDAVRVEAGVAGKVQVDQVTAKQLTVVLGPSGVVTLSGQADVVTADTNMGTTTLKGTFKQLNAKLSSEAKLQVSGTIPALTATVAGSSSLDVSGDLGTAAVTVEGGASAKVAGKMTSLGAKLAGSGELTATGTAGTLYVDAAGSGKLTADQLQAEQVVVKAASAAELTVWATKTLSATAENSGVVRYKGSPKLDRRVENSGEVVPLGK